MPKEIVKINGKELNIGRVLISRKNKTVKDFITELTPNIESITMYTYRNGKKPFRDKEHLKQWLISNQEGYPKFNYEIYAYFVDKCGFNKK